MLPLSRPRLTVGRLHTVGAAGLVLLLVLVACSSAAPTPTPLPPTALPPTQLPAPAGLTAAQRAPLGEAVYSRSCAACHNPLSASNLRRSFDRFNNAGEMLSYAQRAMPQTNPGSLPAEDYLNVIVWVLLDNGKVAADAVLDADNLAEVTLR
ncbi:MAG: cytochrome c [Chloroflexi bacterium]|nr:cytochrome c [Chloroflexota bacterium]